MKFSSQVAFLFGSLQQVYLAHGENLRRDLKIKSEKRRSKNVFASRGCATGLTQVTEDENSQNAFRTACLQGKKGKKGPATSAPSRPSTSRFSTPITTPNITQSVPPSAQPSSSSSPSTTPSSTPSTTPSTTPSASPSAQPSSSSSPSSAPSTTPSTTPSASPSAQPSSSSSPSSAPSATPSTTPSASPSTQPSSSSSPSSAPSSTPSTYPSTAPSFESASHSVCGNVAVAAGSTITFAGTEPTMIHNGNLNLYPGISITGPHKTDVGYEATYFSYVADSMRDALTAAMEEESTAIRMANNEMGGVVPAFVPGTYSFAEITIAANSVVALNGDGKYLFISNTTLVAEENIRFNLMGGAKAENILWALGGSGALGVNSTFEGSILASSSIIFGEDSTLHGCAFAQAGAVTFAGPGYVEVIHYEADDGSNLRG